MICHIFQRHSLGCSAAWLALLGSAFLAGCAPQAPVTRPSSDTVSERPSTPKRNPYVFTTATIQSPRTVYLVKTATGWDVSFAARDLNDAQVEKLLYSPSDKKVQLAFAKGATDRAVCKEGDHRRNASTYSPCSSNFRMKESFSGGRALAALLTGGATEINSAAYGLSWFVIDSGALLQALADLGLEDRVQRFDYQRDFALAKSRASLAGFVQKYSSHDPDGLVPRAQGQIREIDANGALLSQANAALPTLTSYQSRYTPANPFRYCGQFRGDAEAMKVCQNDARSIVASLATNKAKEARRYDLCGKVSQIVAGSAKRKLCDDFRANGSCSVGASGERSSSADEKICSVLAAAKE